MTTQGVEIDRFRSAWRRLFVSRHSLGSPWLAVSPSSGSSRSRDFFMTGRIQCWASPKSAACLPCLSWCSCCGGLFRAFGALRGLYRNVLDFLAMRSWHPALIAALIGLLVVPGVWFSHVDKDLFFLLRIMGWPRALKSGDFRDDLDRVATLYQLALMGGIPLLFGLHLLSRWQTKRRLLVWLLLPIFFLGTAVAIVVIGTIAHFANN